MPLYDYKCLKCGDIESVFIHSISRVDETIVLCKACSRIDFVSGPGTGLDFEAHDVKMVRLLNVGVKMQTATGAFFEPYMETDLGPEPVQINSVEHLQAECRKRGMGCKKMPPKPAK
jgi:hypothetical protein